MKKIIIITSISILISSCTTNKYLCNNMNFRESGTLPKSNCFQFITVSQTSPFLKGLVKMRNSAKPSDDKAIYNKFISSITKEFKAKNIYYNKTTDTSIKLKHLKNFQNTTAKYRKKYKLVASYFNNTNSYVEVFRINDQVLIDKILNFKYSPISKNIENTEKNNDSKQKN